VEAPGSPPSCHLTDLPTESCVDALDARVGALSADLHFERVEWDDAKAGAARSGEVTTPGHADLAVVAEGLRNHRVVYRYVAPGSCALVEGCVGASGWRRLLQFDASVKNVGGRALTIGQVDDSLDPEAMTPLRSHNIFEYSACHEHYHFSHYGEQSFGSAPGEKRAFCLQSTQRYANHESSPLVNDFGTCSFQGIEAGWGDDYIAGLDCQWIDLTDEATGAVMAPLTFSVNPDQFLCEGVPKYEEDGTLAFEPTEFMSAEGKPVDRPACRRAEGIGGNNTARVDVPLPAGSFVTSPCQREANGPLRDCGFSESGGITGCTPAGRVTLTCNVTDAARPMVLRACEASRVLATGTACVFGDALANTIVGATPTTVELDCPAGRDERETGGQFQLYAAPVLRDDAPQTVTCR
jgi:hypothetical protein